MNQRGRDDPLVQSLAYPVRSRRKRGANRRASSAPGTSRTTCAVPPRTRPARLARSASVSLRVGLVHDFTRLSGEGPEVIARQLDMFVQPEVLSAKPTPS